MADFAFTGGTSGTAVNSANAVSPSNFLVGQLIKVGVGVFGANAATISLSDGTHTYNAPANAGAINAGGSYRTQDFWVLVTTELTTPTLTASLSGGLTGHISITVDVRDGPWVASPLDQNPACTTAVNDTPSITSAALVQADELALSTIYIGNGSAITVTPGGTPTFGLVTNGSFNNPDSEQITEIAASTSSTSAVTASATLSSSSNWQMSLMTFKRGVAAPVEQEGARFGVDDGGESAHTWAQAQDANDAVAVGTARLIRLLVNGTGDPASTAYTLRYQKNGAGGYLPVPVGASVAESYGTVTFGAIGTGANGGTTVAPQPASPPAGAYMLAVITSGATNSETPTAPDGTWSLLATGASTDGTYGIDTGPRRVTVFGKVATGSEGTTAITFSITNGGSCRGTISHFTKSGSGAWVVEAMGGNDSTSGTGVSIAFASMNWNTGDVAVVATGQRVDSATQSAQSLTATGVTFGTRTNRAATAVTTGNDHRHSVDTFAAITGTSNVNAAPTWAYTASAAASAGGVIVRLRAYTAPVTNEIYIAPSANIAAGGEATTARLTAPSGKTTSDFTTGRRWDDENGTDAVDIAADFYTELEWCVNTQSPAVDTDYFDFRVYAGAVALDTYTVTPRLTLGTPVTPVSPYYQLLIQPSFAARFAAMLRH